jgi:hypothetical protein
VVEPEKVVEGGKKVVMGEREESGGRMTRRKWWKDEESRGRRVKDNDGTNINEKVVGQKTVVEG